MKVKVRRLAVLASGSGTTLQAIIDAIESEVLDTNIVTVVSDREDSFALTRAQTSSIETYVLRANTAEERDEELHEILKKADPDLVVLAGYLKPIETKVLSDFTVINTHPSLLPKYG